jgi:hypothetical protein
MPLAMYTNANDCDANLSFSHGALRFGASIGSKCKEWRDRDDMALRNSDAVVPMPILVGSPRSGTTLLRLMLDAHPLLAIPPETGFIPAVAALSGTSTQRRAAFAARLTLSSGWSGNWPDFGLSAESLWAKLQAVEPFDSSTGLRVFYQLYAGRFGKPRWGDKTPLYCRHLQRIQDVLPEARFIHLIRDGRDVAVSLRRRWFSPGHSIERQAWFWRRNIERARREASCCRHYLEVRYEALVLNPEATLRRICAFIDLAFDASMLLYWKHAAERLAEHQQRVDAAGSVLLSQAQRQLQQQCAAAAPDPGRIGAWRGELRRDEHWRFRLVAGRLLDQLGYPR